ncbi:Glycosyltransferase like family 2 [Arthrobacter subterraneus]|uniref:Glycosyltransferase like family 2 n=1 Tax=Arthrobacter subterraneus TaxID=335973 RepID=A0A1G8H9R0_9MICC|nr:glycosyltransferase [Arthrobacter subterraneus]SDI03367.1 Glycosyltransferase like family 2 [Arthrobacter subterraneus]
MSRRWSGEWGRNAPAGEPSLEVLVPSYNRAAELAVTLSGLAAQDGPDFAVILSDQSDAEPVWDEPAVAAMIRVLRVQGRAVTLERNLPRRGVAQQRQFLLERSSAPEVLFLDNDVWLEPGMIARMHAALRDAGCGLVGAAVQGLSYLDDRREHERHSLEFWEHGVHPEQVRPDRPSFERWPLHNAANLTHTAAELDLAPGDWRLYKVAWVGGCVLFNRAALVECGGFDFWDRLPPNHAGEDVTAQWRVMERFGGAGILPSGAVHLESPTTVPDRATDAAGVVLGVERH